MYKPLSILIVISVFGMIIASIICRNNEPKQSELLLENVESLTSNENSPIENEYIACVGEAKWDIVGIETYYFTVNTHDQSSSDKDFLQDYVMSCCIASGEGSKTGRNTPPVATVTQGLERRSDCKSQHYSLDYYVSLITSLIY